MSAEIQNIIAEYSTTLGQSFTIVALVGMASVFAQLFFRLMFIQGIRSTLRVAVIGRSQSGKTSLITIFFDRIISGKAARYVSVTGTDTADRVRDQLLKLTTDLYIGPTRDKDVFSYRYNVNKPFLFVKRKIAVEVADFPGEYSEELGSNYSNEIEYNPHESLGLYRKEFFSWVVNADRYIFVIDGAKAFELFQSDQRGFEDYVAITTIELKNAVIRLKQELLDDDVSRRHVMLVFSKADVFDHKYGYKNLLPDGEISTRITSLNIEKEYDDLFQFMRNNFRSVESVRHSSLARTRDATEATDRLVNFTSPVRV